MLIPNYYTIIGQEQQGDNTWRFWFVLNPKAEVYKGHFPGNPIAPGVCTLQMIKECVQVVLACDNLRFSLIKQCRFSRLLRPSEEELELVITLSENQWVEAQILQDTQLCMKIKEQYIQS